MLMISRSYRERIRFKADNGTEIWIEIAELRPNSVRLGITAPQSVVVAREELVPVEERCPR